MISTSLSTFSLKWRIYRAFNVLKWCPAISYLNGAIIVYGILNGAFNHRALLVPQGQRQDAQNDQEQ